MPGYKSFAALVAVAFAVLAQPARADDDAAALRAELDSLKSDYRRPRRGARGAHRRARIRCRARATGGSRPGRVRGEQRFGVQSGDLAGARGQLRRHVARPGRLAHRRLHAERRRSRARRAQLQSRRVRDDALRPASTRISRRQLTAAITGEDEIEVEEAFFRTLALPAGFIAQGRTILLGLRLPERGARARLGFRRTSRWSTRRFSATSSRRTACSSSGSRRRTSSSSSAPRPAMATRFPARASAATA